MIETARVQCVFVDVVEFTKSRSVEAQSAIVHALNGIVHSSLSSVRVPPAAAVLLPTGDGVAIALLNLPDVDVHVRLALDILGRLAKHNGATADHSRHFQLRTGINENKDNVVDDVNGNRNVAGAGISFARRLMDLADGGQILVGESVYDTLRYREGYEGKWRQFMARVKHGESIRVHQFIDNHLGLNANEPTAFAHPMPGNLDRRTAYYIAHALKNRAYLLTRHRYFREHTAVLLLSFLAQDSETRSGKRHAKATAITWTAGEGTTFAEQCLYYDAQDFGVTRQLCEFIERDLEPYRSLFDDHQDHEDEKCYWLVNERGIKLLKEQWMNIAKEFGVDKMEPLRKRW